MFSHVAIFMNLLGNFFFFVTLIYTLKLGKLRLHVLKLSFSKPYCFLVFYTFRILEKHGEINKILEGNSLRDVVIFLYTLSPVLASSQG